MPSSQETLDQQFLEMRWRVLSLAADLDRIGHSKHLPAPTLDARMDKLRRSLRVLLEADANRAEQVQMIFSDLTPPPPTDRRSAIGNRQ